MKAVPRVSIITPAYNHAGYIRQCIESVRSGNYQDWEMLVVDDGSTDGTADVVRSIDDPRVRLFQKANGGIARLAEVYNLALEHAQGDLLAILEGDDYWPPDKLSLQVPEFDDPAVVLVSGFAQVVDDEGTVLGRIPSEPMPGGAQTNQPIGTATRTMFEPFTLMFTFPVATMLRRSAVERIGGFRQPSDLPLVDYPTILALSVEGEFRFVPQTCGFWRRHAQSTTKSRYPDIVNGCYREATRLAWAERDRLGLSPSDLDAIEARWEHHQAYRCTLMARLLAQEGRRKDASRAFLIGNRFRRPKSSQQIATAASWVSRLGLPVEWLYRLVHRGPGAKSLAEQVYFMDDPLVRTSDLDYAWPVHRHGHSA